MTECSFRLDYDDYGGDSRGEIVNIGAGVTHNQCSTQPVLNLVCSGVEDGVGSNMQW